MNFNICNPNLSNAVEAMWNRIEDAKMNSYYYNFNPINSLDSSNAWVDTVDGKKLMFATYNYLGLLGDSRINDAAIRAVEKYGTGTHGVRIFGGNLDLHEVLETKIARFTKREAAIVYSTGYMTNLTTINSLVSNKDWIISDRLNHASIVDGCLISKAHFKRFQHNDMNDLERLLKIAPLGITKLVIADAVFSMDGDIFNLPDAYKLCKKYGAILMIDEAHSLGVLGKTGRGIEEHYGLENVIDVKMGTLSKAIPAIGGYISGDEKLINYLKHSARGFVFSAALSPPIAAAALEALDIIEKEFSTLQKKLNHNFKRFSQGLSQAGLNIGNSETSIVPVIVGSNDLAMKITSICQEKNVFALPVLTPAVPPMTARMRLNVTVKHSNEDIDYAINTIVQAAKELQII